MKKAWKQTMWFRAAVCFAAAVFCSGLVEIAANLPVWSGRQITEWNILPEELETEGFEVNQGMLEKAAGSPGKIVIQFPQQYIGKLYLYYREEASGLKCTLNSYREKNGEELVSSVSDSNNILYDTSVINVNDHSNKLEFVFPQETACTISGIRVDNTASVSPWRMLFVFGMVFLILFILTLHKSFQKKEEWFFLLAGGIMGFICLAALPAHKVGWDEEIHFERAYSLSYLMEGKQEMFYPPAAEHFSAVSYPNWPYDVSQSKEEHVEEMQKWNELGSWEFRERDDCYKETLSLELSSIGYVAQALFLEIGKLFKVPFSILYYLGRLGNLLMYLGVTFFAIRHLRMGKRVMTAVMLMPTPLFLACVYSYDATANAFALLGISYALGEVVSEEKRVSGKNIAVYLAAFTVASFVKAIYAPLILLGLLIPRDRFRDERQRKVWKAAFCALSLVLMATFVLPALGASPAEAADTRGGDTSVGRQMRLIFSDPLRYAWLLGRNIYTQLVNFSVGTDAMGLLGHADYGCLPDAPAVLLPILALTDMRGGEGTLRTRSKLFAGVLMAVVCALIWTALYLSFNPVGADYITGVQGRYFIPVTMVGLLMLKSDRLQYRGRQETYNIAAMTAVVLITLTNYFTVFISKCL